MNSADAFFTALYLDLNKINETNPMIGIIIEHFGLVNMIIFKIFFVSSIIILLIPFRNHKLAKKGITFTFLIYYTLMIWQLILTYFLI